MGRVEARVASSESSTNEFLRGLPEAEQSALRPLLEAVTLPLGAELFAPDEPIRHVYFLDRGAVASVIAPTRRDHGVEVGVIGYEGFVGLVVLFEGDREPFRTIVQGAGCGWRVPVGEFRIQVGERPAFRTACLRFAREYSIQVAQDSACNRSHTIKQRCAKWLLMMHDRATGDTFSMTHEFLAAMLGVRRAGVSQVANRLRRDGLIHYSRAKLAIRDRSGLEAAACSCYGVMRAHAVAAEPRKDRALHLA